MTTLNGRRKGDSITTPELQVSSASTLRFTPVSGNVGASIGVQQWCDKEQPHRSTLPEPLFPFCNSLQEAVSAYFLLTLQEHN